jgi:hypothetical protein
MSADWLQERPGAVTIAVKVQPRAGRNAVGKAEGHELQVRVAAPRTKRCSVFWLAALIVRALPCASFVASIRGTSWWKCAASPARRFGRGCGRPVDFAFRSCQRDGFFPHCT